MYGAWISPRTSCGCVWSMRAFSVHSRPCFYRRGKTSCARQCIPVSRSNRVKDVYHPALSLGGVWTQYDVLARQVAWRVSRQQDDQNVTTLQSLELVKIPHLSSWKCISFRSSNHRQCLSWKHDWSMTPQVLGGVANVYHQLSGIVHRHSAGPLEGYQSAQQSRGHLPRYHR